MYTGDVRFIESNSMKVQHLTFIETEILRELKHYLPAQAPLKDFIHHNTLHAFQSRTFDEATRMGSSIFGYRTLLSLEEYRDLYKKKSISEDVLKRTIAEYKGSGSVDVWHRQMLHTDFTHVDLPRIGSLRAHWKKTYQIDLDSLVHPTLFRILCSYLDQGIAIWNFPVWHRGFLSSIRELERTSFVSFFRKPRARQLLLESHCGIQHLLNLLIGDESLYEHYLFDQQFAHQGWSGMVSAIEDDPHSLLDTRKITVHDLVTLELLLEIDALDGQFGEDDWSPLATRLDKKPMSLFAEVHTTDHHEVLLLWQKAFEWTYYDGILRRLQNNQYSPSGNTVSFQAMFCIDDRACSIRRHIESLDPESKTYGTPGFFGVEFYYKPEHSKFMTKLCPAPVTPKYLIKAVEASSKQEKDLHFTKHSHSLFRGWLISQTLGFWSAIKLFANIFRPAASPATASSFRHMDKFTRLTIESQHPEHRENNLQVGFTVPEMADRVEGLLRSIGLVSDFAPLVYVIGHGSSSVNNPHYAAYDCGACSGRPGSVNARVISFMANHQAVRQILRDRGIDIPVNTQFVGGLHDTTRDEIMFFDEDKLFTDNKSLHLRNTAVMLKALVLNAKERSSKFESIPQDATPEQALEAVQLRSVSLFEPRPELNHATNALCIVGRRELTRGVYLDRRSFLNSYDYRIDPDGKYLFNILKAAAPVCGGINLEYYFSRVDNQKLGAGTKLPHNVMGLFGVANGIEGDLRPGLPSQMIEIHDPVRLLIIVEHNPEVVLNTIQRAQETYEWFVNNWVNLIVIQPETRELLVYKDRNFVPYQIPKQVGQPVLQSGDAAYHLIA
jgi:hypothetical protein